MVGFPAQGRRQLRLRGVVLGVAVGLVASGALAGSAAAPRLDIEAPPELSRQAAALRALEGEDWSSLFRLVGLTSPGRPIRVVLAGERSSLAAHAPSWASGYALPALDTIVLFPGRVPSYPDRNLETLLRHEVAHVMVARASGNGRLPRWFDEGVATVAAREWGVEDSARVVLATIGPGPRSLAQLATGFNADSTAVGRAYAISAALVRSLVREHGDDAIARILAAMAHGEDFAGAFESACGESPAAFGRGYFRSEVVWRTWVPFLTSSTALWMAITLLALWATKRRRDRDAALRESWATEEGRALPPSPRLPDEDDPSRLN
jgi:hypothetical protein